MITPGQDLLTAVALGDRKAKPGLIKSEKHKAAKELHSPKTMAMIAVNQASGYFLGPFGVGLKAIEMVNKDSGAAPRAAAVDQLAQQHTDEVHAGSGRGPDGRRTGCARGGCEGSGPLAGRGDGETDAADVRRQPIWPCG